MRHATISTSIVSSPSAISEDKPTRRSLFASILEALHHSRRLQAQRVLAQYRHLIARHEQTDSTKAEGKTDAGL